MEHGIKNVKNKIILESMKKVFESEIVELEKELEELYRKYNVKSSSEMELIKCKDEEMERDFNRMVEIEKNLENLRKYLRDLNIKTL